MALSLAACGGSSSTTTTPVSETPVVVTPTAQTLLLTTRSDELTGGDGADTFDGQTAGELNAADVLNGGGGSDTLDVTIADSQPAPTISNIENLVIQSTNDNADIDLDNADTSITSITVTSSATNLDILNIQNNATFTLSDVTSGAAGLTLDFDTDALGSATATLTLALDGSTVALDTVETGNTDDFTSANFSTSGSASALTFDMTDYTTLTFSGSANLEIIGADVFTELTSIAGTSATGGLKLDLDDNAGAYSINLGAGADSITADQANTGTGGRTINLGGGKDTLDLGALGAESDDVFTGGEGEDTIIFADTSDITVANTAGVSGFERLVLSEAATLDMNDFADRGAQFTIIKADSTTDGAALTINNVGSSVTTLELDATNASDGNVDADEDVVFDRLVDGTADSLTVKVTAAANLGDELIVDDEETITIDTNAAALTLNTGISAADLTALTIVGDNNVDLSALDGTKVATVDASGMTATATLTFTSTTSTAAMTVTGGTSTGTVTVTTGSGNDTVTAGSGTLVATTAAGNDTVTGGAKADTIDTGSGHDTIVTGNGGGTVTGGTGNDTINITNTTAIEDVVVFAEYGQGNYDVITGFTVGSATTADELTMLTSDMGWNSTSGAGAAVVDTGASLKAGVDAGNDDTTVSTISTDMASNSIDNFLAGTSSYSDLLSAGAAAMGLSGDLDAAAILGVFVDDGEHTALFRFVSSDDGVDDLVTSSELELVAIFSGVDDATEILAGNLNAFA
jgi:hypothetical protein